MSVFLWILVILATLVVGLPVGISHFGHLLGMRTHRWHVRQIAARKVVEPSKRFGCWEMTEDRWHNWGKCNTKAEAPCGRCWEHCDKCVRTESNNSDRKIAAAQYRNKQLEIEMGLDR